MFLLVYISFYSLYKTFINKDNHILYIGDLMDFKRPKIRVVQIKLDDKTYKAFKKLKGGRQWSDFVYDLVTPINLEKY